MRTSNLSVTIAMLLFGVLAIEFTSAVEVTSFRRRRAAATPAPTPWTAAPGSTTAPGHYAAWSKARDVGEKARYGGPTIVPSIGRDVSADLCYLRPPLFRTNVAGTICCCAHSSQHHLCRYYCLLNADGRVAGQYREDVQDSNGAVSYGGSTNANGGGDGGKVPVCPRPKHPFNTKHCACHMISDGTSRTMECQRFVLPTLLSASTTLCSVEP